MPLEFSKYKKIAPLLASGVVLLSMIVTICACSSTSRPSDRNIRLSTGMKDSWLSQPPRTDYLRKNDGALSKEHFFEVVASSVDGAIYGYLDDKEYLCLDESEARHFTGEYFVCPPGRKTYLVRAAYVHGMTGGYRLVRLGNSLVVYHESLGPDIGFHKSAIVVNLNFDLERVITVAKVFP